MSLRDRLWADTMRRVEENAKRAELERKKEQTLWAKMIQAMQKCKIKRSHP